MTEIKKIPKQKRSGALEEYQWIANCLQIGLTLQDLKELEYKDVAKIMLCFHDHKNENNATQSDWDRLARS